MLSVSLFHLHLPSLTLPMPSLQAASLSTLLSLIESEGSTRTLTLHTYSFPNSLLHQITEHLLDDQTDMSSLIGQFEEYLAYDDVRFHWMKNIV